MNESIGADPAEVLTPRPQLPVPAALDDLDYQDSESEPPLTPRREGLPTGFRMRHDKHYVEELMSTPTLARAAVSDAPPQPSTAALELIAGRLESAVAHGAISRGHAGSADLVSRSVQAELQRVSRFARAVAVSARQAEPARRSVTAGEIAAAVRTACTRLARLNGMHCLVTVDDAAFAIAADRALVVQGIAGTVDALLDLAQTAATDDNLDDVGRITVSLQAAKVRPALIVDIECATLAWRVTPADRFFDNGEQDFAFAPAAGILLASAAHVVRLHGGRVEAQLQGGVSLRYVFPHP